MKNRPNPLGLNNLRDEYKTIKVIIKKEIIDDPYEQNKVASTLFNPKYIKGITREIDASRITWELYGLKDKGALELVCDKKHKSLLEKCSNLYIDSVQYLVYKTANGKHSSITSKGKYLVIILERV